METKINNENAINETIIGIDLGMAVSRVAVWRNGKVDIIVNNHGQRTTPSWVTFTANGILIGEAGKLKQLSHAKNAIYGLKRLMGKRFMDQDLEKDKAAWPFRVVNDIGRCKIRIEVKGKEPKEYSPEEISSFILMHLKEIAENYLGHKVTKAVVTVPAYFNDDQRQATKYAGTISGFKIVRVLNEPIAAVIAHGWENNIGEQMQHKILVYHLNRTTFDVSVVEVDNGNYAVIGADGDTHLGGVDIDNNLYNYFVEEFKTKYHKDINSDANHIYRLRRKCEKIKRELSQHSKVGLTIDCILDEDFEMNMTRAHFEDINSDIFLKTIDIVKRCLKKAKLLPKDIDKIVLVGGSTRIPKVEEMIQDLFGGKKMNKFINTEEALAAGAAIYAANFFSFFPETDIPRLMKQNENFVKEIEELKQYQETENNANKLKADSMKQTIIQLNQQTSKSQRNENIWRKKYNDAVFEKDKQIKGLESKMKENYAENNKLNKELIIEYEEKLKDRIQQMEAFKSNENDLRRNYDDAVFEKDGQIKMLKLEMKDLSKMLEKNDAEIDKLKIELKDRDEILRDKEQKLKDRTQQMDIFKSKEKDLRRQIQDFKYQSNKK